MNRMEKSSRSTALFVSTTCLTIRFFLGPPVEDGFGSMATEIGSALRQEAQIVLAVPVLDLALAASFKLVALG